VTPTKSRAEINRDAMSALYSHAYHALRSKVKDARSTKVLKQFHPKKMPGDFHRLAFDTIQSF